MKVDYQTTAAEIAEHCDGRLIAGSEIQVIESISSDSRDLGERSLFVPLRGEKFDGHNYIKGLVEAKSIVAFLTENKGDSNLVKGTDIVVILCESTLAALGRIAQYHRNSINPEVIVITGTNGKTTTKEFIAAILNEKYNLLKSEKNFNNEIGVPFTLLGLKDSHTMAVIEMGMNHLG